MEDELYPGDQTRTQMVTIFLGLWNFSVKVR